MSDTILAIDLGRYKSLACVYHRTTREHTFRTVDSTPEAVDRLLARHPERVRGRLERQLKRRAKELGFEVVKAADPPDGTDTPVSRPPGE